MFDAFFQRPRPAASSCDDYSPPELEGARKHRSDRQNDVMGSHNTHRACAHHPTTQP